MQKFPPNPSKGFDVGTDRPVYKHNLPLMQQNFTNWTYGEHRNTLPQTQPRNPFCLQCPKIYVPYIQIYSLFWVFYWANKQTRRKNKRKLTGFRGHYMEASSDPQTHNRNIYPLWRNKGVGTGSHCLHYQVNNNKNNFS